MKKVDTTEIAGIGEIITVHTYSLDLDDDLKDVRLKLETLHEVEGEAVVFVPILAAKVTTRLKTLPDARPKPKPDDYLDQPRKKKK